MYQISSHTNRQPSLTVSIAGEAVDLMQPGVRLAHGVEFGVSKGTLLPHINTRSNALTQRMKTRKQHARASAYTTRLSSGEQKKTWGWGGNESMSHHIYRRPLLSGWRVLALAFPERGRSTAAGGQRGNIHRADRYDQHPTPARGTKRPVKQGS